MNRYFSLASADLVVIDTDAWGLWWDFTTLRELVDTLPGNTILQNKALVAANEIMNVFGRGKNHEDIIKARKVAERVFGEAWESKGEKIYKEGAQRPQIWGIGYCHIDTAWYVPSLQPPLSHEKQYIYCLKGYGPILLPNRKLLAHGLLKLISWIAIPSIASHVHRRNNSNGSNRLVDLSLPHSCSNQHDIAIPSSFRESEREGFIRSIPGKLRFYLLY
jgi:hypothetical protein